MKICAFSYELNPKAYVEPSV